MPTLYVENVPEDIYDALRSRAREHQNSISAEVLTLLKENVPTGKELARRKQLFNRALRIRAARPRASGPFPTTEEMQRDDRLR
jgi:plasmid stability protein